MSRSTPEKGADNPEIEGLEVIVTDGTGKRVRGDVANVTVVGAAVSFFGADELPELEMGAPAKLTFSAQKLGKPVDVIAVLTSRVAEGESQIYGFRFRDRLDFVQPKLFQLFNRRGAHRVAPARGDHIEVALKVLDGDSGPELPAVRLIDISASGCCLEIPEVLDKLLADTVLVQVSFELPGRKGTPTLVATIANRRTQKNSVHYGLHFDPERTSFYVRQEQSILRYIAQRQQEVLQETLR